MRRFVLYATVGASGTAVQYAILWILVTTGSAPAPIASTVGAIAGAIVNYLLNFHLTFGSHGRHRAAAPKFFATSVLGMALNYLLMSAQTEVLGLHYLIAQFMSTALVLCVTFIVNASWSFKGKHS
ncbi:GtrA domain-containing protein [Paraburkholderia unamae]|uniref:GtrA family protein n=1 Tax=Paraburkholderia unamae TaxID=219649 RepID=UPI001CB3A29C|nr:GtrA family protein [Paraburkholderia unamae]CAG9255589.1 GtrA domain-containing protein [Paraburkholderia unamae]